MDMREPDSAMLVREIARELAVGSPLYSQVAQILSQHFDAIEPWFDLWQQHMGNFLDLGASDESLLEITMLHREGAATYFTQLYCRCVIDHFTKECVNTALDDIPPGLLYLPTDINDLVSSTIRKRTSFTFPRFDDPIDYATVLALFHQQLLPASTRHHSGEYYTPSWLALRCINHITPPSVAHSCLDPSCGSGLFLVLWGMKTATAERLIGVDINPLAVHLLHLSLGHLKRWLCRERQRVIEYEGHVADFIVDPLMDRDLFTDGSIELFNHHFAREEKLDDDRQILEVSHAASAPGAESRDSVYDEVILGILRGVHLVVKGFRAEVVLGNPPWIAWDGLPEHYRKRVAEQWAKSPLTTQRGWLARVAAGKTDVSSLFVYRAVERHTVRNAQMGFVLPISLFQSRRAGEGFRRFTTSAGRQYALRRLDDFSEVQLFDQAVNRACVSIFNVDQTPAYPVPAKRWFKSNGKLTSHQLECRPMLDEEGAPLALLDRRENWLFGAAGGSDYRARGGVNTGGANGILWLELLERKVKFLKVRNVAKTRRTSCKQIEAQVEPAVVFPLVRGTDIDRWCCQPSGHILLCYDTESPKKAIEESLVAKQFPLAFAFASKFEVELRGRREYHRWGGQGPFYEVYRIGPYTFAEHKVVWRHMGFRGRLKAAVVSTADGQIPVPDQKVILIPACSEQEAHYMCGYLNSRWIGKILDKYLGLDASTHVLDFIALKHFDEKSEQHNLLAQLSSLAHTQAAKGVDTTGVEEKIDTVVAELLGI